MADPHASDEEAFAKGFYGVPSEAELRAKSFVEVAALLSNCKEGSPKYLVIDRELKRRISTDQAKINRSNMIIGAVIAGTFTIIGAVVGAWLKSSGGGNVSPYMQPSLIQKPAEPAQPAAQPMHKPSNPPRGTKRDDVTGRGDR